MRICFFGTYTIAEGYPVNRVLLKGLRHAGATVEECREELWGARPLHEVFASANPFALISLAARAVRVYARLMARYRRIGQHDCVVVGYAGYFDVLLARLLNRRDSRTIALVAFISLYDTVVVDRQRFAEGSWQARLLKGIDRLAFDTADLVFADTEAHCRHYAELFELPRSKFHRSFVGEDDDEFRPTVRAARGDALRVLFFGTYVPLHGIDVILEAIERLSHEPGLAFCLIGNGQLFPQMRKRATDQMLPNTTFIGDWVRTSELVRHIADADVCLGIFGTTPKAARVIPYKVFDALAMQKPLVTMDSPAIRELLTDGDTALLCEPGSGESLARSLLRLRDERGLARRLGDRGHALYARRGCPAAIGRDALEVLESSIRDD